MYVDFLCQDLRMRGPLLKTTPIVVVFVLAVLACQDKPYKVSRLGATDQAPRLSSDLDPNPRGTPTPKVLLGYRDPPGRPLGPIQ